MRGGMEPGMDLENDRIIGIVGGMGPRSGVELLNAILAHTEATTDQEHLSSILMSLPKHLADRTGFLNGATEENPAVNIVRIIGMLETLGAKVIGMACNTCHAAPIYDVIVGQLHATGSRVRLVNMPEEVCRFVQRHGRLRRIGVMTTNGTYRSGLYENMLRIYGYEVVLPDGGFQDAVIHKMIYDPEFGLKSRPEVLRPEVEALIRKAFDFFRSKGAEAVILGCTELSLVAKEAMPADIPVFDSIEIMAKALIREARS